MVFVVEHSMLIHSALKDHLLYKVFLNWWTQCASSHISVPLCVPHPQTEYSSRYCLFISIIKKCGPEPLGVSNEKAISIKPVLFVFPHSFFLTYVELWFLEKHAWWATMFLWWLSDLLLTLKWCYRWSQSSHMPVQPWKLWFLKNWDQEVWELAVQ